MAPRPHRFSAKLTLAQAEEVRRRGLIFQSDRGSQYASHGLRGRLWRYQIECIQGVARGLFAGNGVHVAQGSDDLLSVRVGRGS